MTKPVERIMVYLDGSEGSILAMRLAVVLADFMGAELYALSIVNTRALSDLVQSHISSSRRNGRSTERSFLTTAPAISTMPWKWAAKRTFS